MLHKAELQKNLDGPFHGANLLTGDGGDHLQGVGDALVKLEPPAMLQRFQIQLQQDVGIQNAVLHTLQEQNGIIVKVVFFQLEIVVFSVIGHRQLSPS